MGSSGANPFVRIQDATGSRLIRLSPPHAGSTRSLFLPARDIYCTSQKGISGKGLTPPQAAAFIVI